MVTILLHNKPQTYPQKLWKGCFGVFYWKMSTKIYADFAVFKCLALYQHKRPVYFESAFF